MPVDRAGHELKVGQKVAYPVSTGSLGIETIKAIGPKMVTLNTNKWGGFTRRYFSDVVVVEVVE